MSAGFYNLQENILHYAQNGVLTPTTTLLKENCSMYTYPIEGWYYFNSREEAKTFFNYVEIERQPLKEP